MSTKPSDSAAVRTVSLPSERCILQIVVGVLVFFLANRAAMERELPHLASLLRLFEFGLVGAVSGLGFLRARPGRVESATLVLMASAVGSYLLGNAYVDGGPPVMAIATFLGYLPLVFVRGLLISPRFILRAMTVSAVPGVLLGFRQSLIGFTDTETSALLAANATYIVDGSYRLMGSFGTGQEFSVWLSIIIVLLFSDTLVSAEARQSTDSTLAAFLARPVLVGAAVLELIALQRTGILIAVVGCLWAVIKTGSGLSIAALARRIAALITGSALALCLGFLFAPGRASTAVLRLARGSETSSIAGRAASSWTIAAGRISEWPALGGGPASATAASFVYQDHLSVGPLVTDNMTLHISTQTGLLGLFAFLLYSAAIWTTASKHKTMQVHAHSLMVGLAVGGVAASVLGLVTVVGFAALFLGCASRPLEFLGSPSTAPRPREPRWPEAPLPIAGSRSPRDSINAIADSKSDTNKRMQ